jgi:hypothetical protein
MDEDNEDSIVSRSRAQLAGLRQNAIPIDEATGLPRMTPMDVSQMQDDLRVIPSYASINKDNQFIAGKISGTKKLGRDTALQGYLDVNATNDRYNGLRGRGTGAGITLMHNFSKGGKVTASSRADGVAQRGKTKGRFV